MAPPYYGDFAEDDTVDMIFNAYTSDDPSASATITNFINTDVHIHKDLGLTQRNNAAGITVSVDFDGITGNHAIKIDTSDDTVAGFWVTGSEYQVRIEGTTVDGATVNAWVGSFSIERAGGVIALLKLIQAAVITNAAGADVAADIIAVKAETAAIVNDTDVIDDGTSGLVKIASDVAAILVDTADMQPKLGTPAGASIAADLLAIDNFVDDLEGRLTAARAGYLDELAAANIPADIDTLLTRITAAVALASVCTEARLSNLDAAISTRATPAQVNTEVLDVLNVDTFAEPGQEAPGTTVSLVTKIGYLYKFLRNKITNDGSTIEVYNDVKDTVDQKSSVSEAGGTVTRDEFGTGP